MQNEKKEFILTSRTLDAGLVEYLSRRYVVEVWREDDEIHYKLTKKKET